MNLAIESYAAKYNWEVVEKITFEDPLTLSVIQNTLLHKSAIETEGYILRFSIQQFTVYAPHFQSLKVVKELPRQTGIVQPYHFLLIARDQLYLEYNDSSSQDLFTEYFPQWADEYLTIKNMLNLFCNQVDEIYHKNYSEDSKIFADKIKPLKMYWKPLLFLMKAKNLNLPNNYSNIIKIGHSIN